MTVSAYVSVLGQTRKWAGVYAIIGSLSKWFELQGYVFPRSDVLVARALVGVKKMQKG